MEESSIKIHKWLYPVSWLYGMGVALRNKLFDWGKLQSKSFDIPVICIGNIAVGGTGKTPHTEYLIKLLHRNFRVAVLSRGYKRHTKGFILSSFPTYELQWTKTVVMVSKNCSHCKSLLSKLSYWMMHSNTDM